MISKYSFYRQHFAHYQNGLCLYNFLIFQQLYFPTSLAEQSRIAAILGTADEAIANTEALIAKYQSIKTGLMQDLLTCGIDDKGNIRSKRTHKFVTKNGIEVPVEWEVDELKQHCIESAFGPRFSGSLYSKYGNIGTLRTTDLDQEGNINYSTIPLANINRKSFEKHILKENDLLISRSGTVGIVAVFKMQDFDIVPGAFLIRFRFKQTMNPEFLRFFFTNEIGKRILLDLAEGGVQKNLRGSSILKIKIPIPKPEEQVQIINKINQFKETIQCTVQSLAKLQSIKTGLMQDLLSGKK